MLLDKNILILDDEEPVLKALKRELIDEDYNIHITTSVDEALTILKDKKIQIIITDIRMPQINGVNFLIKVKEINIDAIRIALSAYSDINMIIDLINKGEIWRFLSKPWKNIELKKLINDGFKLYYLKMDKEKLIDTIMSQNKELNNINTYLSQKIEVHKNNVLKSFKQLVSLNREMIHRLIKASEYRDDETGKHIVRVGKYAKVIAKYLNMDEQFMYDIEITAPMHDIGKIGIDDSILRKKGKLSNEEFDKIKSHVVIGALILEKSEFKLIKMAHEIALYHHEKWSGKGYIHNLAGDSIPISARICALADVFDALTTERPYKMAFSWEKSLAIIREKRGSHFDPDVVDAFFNGITKIKEIYNKLKE